MGVGTYGICNDYQQAVCIDFSDYEDDSDGEYAYDCLIEGILQALPASFYTVAGEYEDNHTIIAENGLFSIQVCGWESDIGLRVRVKSNLADYGRNMEGLAIANLERTAREFFNKLSETQALRVRTSGWTSGAYQQQAI